MVRCINLKSRSLGIEWGIGGEHDKRVYVVVGLCLECMSGGCSRIGIATRIWRMGGWVGLLWGFRV